MHCSLHEIFGGGIFELSYAQHPHQKDNSKIQYYCFVFAFHAAFVSREQLAWWNFHLCATLSFRPFPV